MTENITVCPECGTEFETTNIVDEMLLQAIEQHCPDCEYSVDVSIIVYPEFREAIGPALDTDTCDHRLVVDSGTDENVVSCDDTAEYRVQQSGSTVEGRCSDHVGEHRRHAIDLQQEL